MAAAWMFFLRYHYHMKKVEPSGERNLSSFYGVVYMLGSRATVAITRDTSTKTFLILSVLLSFIAEKN